MMRQPRRKTYAAPRSATKLADPADTASRQAADPSLDLPTLHATAGNAAITRVFRSGVPNVRHRSNHPAIHRKVISDNGEGLTALKEWKKRSAASWPTAGEKPFAYIGRLNAELKKNGDSLSVGVITHLARTIQIVEPQTLLADFKAWSMTTPPTDGTGWAMHHINFLYSLDAKPTYLPRSTAYKALQALKGEIVAKDAAQAMLWNWSKTRPRLVEIDDYIKTFRESIWQTNGRVLTAGALTELKSVYAIGSGKEVDTEVAAIPLINNHVKDRVSGGLKAEGHVHVYAANQWPDKVADYAVGAPHPTTGLTMSREQAKGLAVNVNAYRDGTEIHADGSRTEIDTIIHEAMHLYQDDGFAAAVGHAAKEGVTEYFARLVVATSQLARRSGYEDEVKSIEKLVGVAGAAKLADGYFKGKTAELKSDVDGKKGDGTWDQWVIYMKARDFSSADALL